MNSEVFTQISDSLRTKVSDFNYKNWFQHVSWQFDEPDHVIIKVPSKFIRDWLQGHYLELIKFELFRHTQREFKIVFKVDRHVSQNLELFAESTDVTLLPLAQPVSGQHAVQQSVRVKRRLGGFNPDYTFENFVVGNSNQLAHAACRAASLQPAKSYNPLFLYGGVGLGKTHLMNAMGMELMHKYPEWKILYVTGEHFTNEVINAIRHDKTSELRKKYRENCDVLLIDDIQFIAGKERTMEEFFHTFNALYEGRKQIILTSDKLPKDIKGLEERLISRFSWGLLADVQAPDFETRIAILQRKAEQEGVVIPMNVLEFIAQNVNTHVRDLEGALVRMVAFASLSRVKINLDLAKNVLHNIVTTAKAKLSVENIQDKVCDFYNLRPADLKSKRRHKNLAVPRQIAMYLCKKHVGASFPEIGSKFGGKDHTTVIHACQKIRSLVDAHENVIKKEVLELEKRLGI